MPQTFTHNHLFAPDTSLLLDEDYTISLWQAGRLVCQQTFVDREFRLLRLFFTRGSAIHLSYEEALASLTQEPIEKCHALLQTAHARDEYEELPRYHFLRAMKPVITTLECCQTRLHRLRLHLCGLVDFGYVLVPYTLPSLF